MNININELLNVVFRALISLIVLFLVTKLIGKKQVSQLSLFDYVIGISIGNFAAEMTINLESEEIYGILAVVIFGGIAYLVSILSIKSIKLRRFFMGTPTILIEHGKILQDSFYKVRYDINDMLEQCRIKGYYDISEIEYAIVEANGELSIMPNGSNRNVTIKDMNLKVEKQGLCANVIIDGKIMYHNLKVINKDVEWLNKELKIKGKKIDDIILSTVDINGKINFYERNKKGKILNVLE
ncbi:MAG: DUF421 domain-containing protein [Bacilli bacterium]|nr:DUF421 domain-containing protein [Bacilli bacterium]MBQ6282513.1 DUF421 domain-containing protein [Bacilli bacterium]